MNRMRVVFCIFSAELLSIVGYYVWISTKKAVGCIVIHVHPFLLFISRSFHNVLWPGIMNFKLKTLDTIVVCVIFIKLAAECFGLVAVL